MPFLLSISVGLFCKLKLVNIQIFMSFKVEYVKEYLKYENDQLKNYFWIIMSLLCSLNFNDSLSSTLLYALCQLQQKKEQHTWIAFKLLTLVQLINIKIGLEQRKKRSQRFIQDIFFFFGSLREVFADKVYYKNTFVDLCQQELLWK